MRKARLIAAATRQTNGYRAYTEAHVEAMRFVRGAQSPGFSLTEIRAVLPQFLGGQFRRADVEHKLNTKMAEINTHIRQLETLKRELKATFASLSCTPDQAVNTAQGTATDSGSGAGARRAGRQATAVQFLSCRGG